MNVYIDPNSYVHLGNTLFEESTTYNRNGCLKPYSYLRNYCGKRGIDLKTIDYWDGNKAGKGDVYVAFDHKNIGRKAYWKLKARNYPLADLDNFERKILFQFEPPVVMPEIKFYLKTGAWFRVYDKVLFTSKMEDERYIYFHTPQAHEEVFPELWNNSERKFLTLINSNRKSFSRYKELLTERVRAVAFFSENSEIDLYGFDWDGLPIFPYWFHKKKIDKVYQGAVESKYKTLSNYDFALAYENCAMEGYITDKIFDCFFTGTVPVYLGATDIEKYIPKNCFIDMRKFNNYKDLRSHLKSLSRSEIKKYKENARSFLESEAFKPFTKKRFAELFVDIIKNGQ